MPKETEITSDEKLHKDIKNAIIHAFQEVEKDQLLGAWYSPIVNAVDTILQPMITVVNKMTTIVDNLEKELVGLVDKFNPKITYILGVSEIEELIKFSQQNFNPSTVYKTLNSLSGMQSNLKAPQTLPLTLLFGELGCLVKNFDAVLSEYTPSFFNGLLNEANTATDNAVKIIAVLEPYLRGEYGIKVPDTFDLAAVIMTLKELNKQLTDIDIKTLDKNIQKEWKPVKIGLVCVLDIIKDILTLLGQIAPLNIALGAGGGVAAGINAHAKASADLISLGKLSWGTVGTIVGILKTLINTGDAYIELRIAQRKEAA